MRRFNPEKELKKIQHGNKNKIIIGVVALLIILEISSSYALYQVRYSKRIIYTKVAPFSNNDIDLAVLVDGKSEDDFPEKDAGKIYDKIDCGKTNVKAYWDYDKWALVLETSKKAKCTVYFKTGTSSSGSEPDTSGANPPELYQGLIPVKYEDKDEDGKPEIIVADPKSTDWYNYDNKQWANAVLISNKGFAADLSGNGNTAKFVGGAQISDEGLVLDGVDDGIYLGDMLKDLLKSSNTLQVKLKLTGVNNDRMVVMGNFDTSSSFVVNYEAYVGNKLRLYWNRGSNEYRTPNSADLYNLITLTFVYDSDNGKIIVYQNDTKFYESGNNTFPKSTLDFNNVYIGRDYSQPCALKGVIEKVIVYDKALNSNEISQNLKAESGKVGGSDGIVNDKLHLYYDFKVDQPIDSIDTTPGEVLDIDYISQMYVWVPRYKYQLFNVNNWGIGEQMINVKFEQGTNSTGDASCTIDSQGKEKCTNALNANWYTHPAFKFGNTDLKGIWVGKFEPNVNNNTDSLNVKPNLVSWRSITIKTMFNASRNIELKYADDLKLNNSQIDTHMMKNMEWGAVAYLTQSKYGRCDSDGSCKNMTINGNEEYLTGYSGTLDAWDTEKGKDASTTGNFYGIYDISGGAWEHSLI